MSMDRILTNRNTLIWLAILLPQSFRPYRRVIVIDPPLYALPGVTISELMDADRLFAAGRCYRPVLPLRIEAVVVAALPEFIFEFFFSHNINIITYSRYNCPYSFSPTFCSISYGTSHLAKSAFRMYYEDTKKE